MFNRAKKVVTQLGKTVYKRLKPLPPEMGICKNCGDYAELTPLGKVCPYCDAW